MGYFADGLVMDAKNRISLTERTHANEMAEKLQSKLREAQRRDTAEADGLRRQVLTLTVGESYETAINVLRSYVDRCSDFYEFQMRVQRHVEHCAELIQAIQLKRNFPGFSQLALSKQQEIHERVLHHFEELRANLKQIEKIERDNRLTDVRSTVWVLQTLSVTVLAVCVTWFMVDVYSGLLSSTIKVTGTLVDNLTTMIVMKLGI